MSKTLLYIISALLIFAACESKTPKFIPPDMQASFANKLKAADSTISIDSFRFIRIDTLYEKWTLVHQRYPYLNDLGKVNKTLDSLSAQKDSLKGIPDGQLLKKISDLQDEKTYLNKEIDSLNNLLAHADTTNPVGYRLGYKASLYRKDASILVDTLYYSLDKQMHVVEWDRNIEKNIEFLLKGKPKD